MSILDVDGCLEDLERRIDPEVEDTLQSEWEAFTDGRFTGDIFSPRRAAKSAAVVDWPSVSVNRAQAATYMAACIATEEPLDTMSRHRTSYII